MLIKRTRDCNEFTANDDSRLRELLHPHSDGLDMPLSLAVARVEPGQQSCPHYLEPVEVYYITEGRGLMHIGEQSAEVEPGDAVYVPAGATQWIENLGETDLVFVVICVPPWSEEGDVRL